MHLVVFFFLSFSLFISQSASAPSESNLVKEFPVIGAPKTKTYTGFINVDEKYGGYLFYTFAEAQTNPLQSPVVIWLQGGPGSSSDFGCWVENGPYIFRANTTVHENPYSWNEQANMLWIDNPVGTGFSFVENTLGHVVDEEQVSKQLYRFLKRWLQVYPEFAKNPLFIFGESYGGKYVPWFAYQIVSDPNTPVNLYGIGLGDGLVSPTNQFASYPGFLLYNNRLNETGYQEYTLKYQQVLQLINESKFEEANSLNNQVFSEMCESANVTNVYNIQEPVDPTVEPTHQMLVYLNRPETRKAMGTNEYMFHSGRLDHLFLTDDITRSSEFIIPILLTKGYPVLLYEGQWDLICNWMGVADYSYSIQWYGQDAFLVAQNSTWGPNGTDAGYYRTADKFHYVFVNNAGHMSPFDQPENVQYMVNTYLAETIKHHSSQKK